MTFPVELSDHASDANFPHDGKPMGMTDILGAGKVVPENEQVRNVDFTVYEEGIYVGYRHFDKAGLAVSYPFGYGLSYTTFALDSLQTELSDGAVLVSLKVTNTGATPGKEVVQLYVAKPGSGIDRPVQELKAFGKTRNLEPGESQGLAFRIAADDLRYWDEQQARWVLEPGTYRIRAGVSSRDIRQETEVEL